MLNVYDFHTEPETLVQMSVPDDFKFDEDMVYDAVKYIREHVVGDEISDEFEDISKVFGVQFEKCTYTISPGGILCAIFPLGNTAMNSWAVYLICDENKIRGHFTRFGRPTDFCKNVPAPAYRSQDQKFVRDMLIKGLRALALKELND